MDNSTKYITETFDHILSSKGVTRVQWIALYYLGKDESMNQKELADLMKIKESTVARLIDRMRKAGLVSRERSKKDKRAFDIKLTEKGIKYRKDLMPEGDKFNNMVNKGISEEEMEFFMKILNKMKNNVKEHELNEN